MTMETSILLPPMATDRYQGLGPAAFSTCCALGPVFALRKNAVSDMCKKEWSSPIRGINSMIIAHFQLVGGLNPSEKY